MPKKIRELKKMLRKAGFQQIPVKAVIQIGFILYTQEKLPYQGKIAVTLKYTKREKPNKLLRKSTENEQMNKLKYQMVIQWSDEDNCFLVALPDFPGSYWRTHGDTYDEAFANGKEALESLILAYESTGDDLPIPKVASSV